MKLKLISGADELISNMRSFFQINNSKQNQTVEEPLREELFSSEQMERYGKSLALKHKLSNKKGKDYLLKRLSDNENMLQEVRKLLTESIQNKDEVTPAGEWLLDNFYLIEEQIRLAKTHFPKNYSEDLPLLTDGTSAFETRSYDIVLKFISHSDGRIDIESLGSFLNSYQSVTYLKLGELWSIPIMLRLALIENIRLVSANIAIDKVDRNLANFWVEKMIETAENSPKDLILVIGDMARTKPPVSGAFVSEFTRQLRGKGPDLGLVLNWIEQQLSGSGLTSSELVNAENHKQAADQVSMSNSIGSLRLLSTIDWREFVESHSIVEKILREDTDGTYPLMDFATRDRYRHVVETIAKNSNKEEEEVARIAINLTKETINTDNDDRYSHVGYFLIGRGVAITKKQALFRSSASAAIRQKFKIHASFWYSLSIFLLTFSIGGGVLLLADSDTNKVWLLVAVTIITIICASQLGVSVVNFISTLLVKPNLLPRMDFSKQIPESAATIAVVPSLLTNKNEINELLESLEVRFLANRNKNLYFGLLTDFTDADTETMPEDDELLQLVINGINSLNNKYSKGETTLFFLFHRFRKWNAAEKKWMGYERKRGKLSDLNSLITLKDKSPFSIILGHEEIIYKLKYVITLDADTLLPLGTAWKMIGTMAHPLNHPYFDNKKQRVTKGYGILQPRVTVSLPDIKTSIYAKMHGNEPGIDPYTRASSDVYQDLFKEGSYIGKGIYDVNIFQKVLNKKFPDNRILSHDLLEGCYIRSGLLSDVQLFEKYPKTYSADMKMRERWVRGDWQIIGWIFPWVKGGDSHIHKNPISFLSKWKIFDNIRRSLVPPALTTLLIIGWFLLPNPMLWTLIVTGIIIFPVILTTIWDVFMKPKDVILSYHVKNSLRNIRDLIAKTFFSLICLPYEAFLNISAIARSLWRMIISKRKFLEWTPSSQYINSMKSSLWNSYGKMWIEPFLTISIVVLLAIYLPGRLDIAGPIIFFWLLAPFITWFTSKPLNEPTSHLTHGQLDFLRKLARKTWSYFDHFVTVTDNWLPPDNFQEQPVADIAHRTSPTNIGLYLLSSLSAHDFGYISLKDFLARVRNTFTTLCKMEKFRGHFFNWYDTISLEPLPPKYVSTVDSGNLAGHLLVLRQGLLALPHRKINIKQIYTGLLDAILILEDSANENELEKLSRFVIQIKDVVNNESISQFEMINGLKILSRDFNSEFILTDSKAASEFNRWSDLFIVQLNDAISFLNIFSPWQLLSEAKSELINAIIIPESTSLIEILQFANELKNKINAENNAVQIDGKEDNSLLKALEVTIATTLDILISAKELAEQCNQFADMEWDFLYDTSCQLFTIGYNVYDHRRDASYYDLLASEVRLCIFVCIAQGKLPEESWFALGRLLTNVNRKSILLSWSGSMFEYLMPLLVMPTYENTLLDQTYRSAVEWQIEYGKKANLPWGISESGYNMINANSHYQYRAFGAPGLGLKRGLDEDAVIAPYASIMALMVSPEKAVENLQVLTKKGLQGKYGMYEAVDYTPSRLPRGKSSAIIYSFMAHHHGMSLLSLAYLLCEKPMQKLFEAEPRFMATLLLLQEKIPRATTFFAHTTQIADVNYVAISHETRVITTPNTPIPNVLLLSNGRYHVMITNSGGGYSRWKDMAVTRWREDVTCDNWGTFFYIKDIESNKYWSNTFQPALSKADKYEVTYSTGRVDFNTQQNGIETHTEIVVSPEDDVEVRRLKIINRSSKRRTIEITSYTEVVLASQASDMIAPAFSNLFVQTEIIPQHHAIICTRRPRSQNEKTPWMFHLMTCEGKKIEEISYETSRAEFIGRDNTIVNPKALNLSGKLSGQDGSVLDPVVAIRYKIIIEPDEVVNFDMVIGITESKEICQSLINKYEYNSFHKDRVFEMAWSHSQVVLRQINASVTDAQLYSMLAGSIIYTNSSFRADPSILINNHRQQSGLWGYSISGDLPIVLLKIESQANLQMVKQMIQAHSYWRLKGLIVDLVIWNEAHDGYRQDFQNEILALIPMELKDHQGGIFLRAGDQVSNEDRILFQTVARIIVADSGGTLEEHIKRAVPAKFQIPALNPPEAGRAVVKDPLPLPDDLIFNNGHGGFAPNGKEYVVITNDNSKTPAPWVNIMANPFFGSVVSESGSAYTWIENAHELRLSSWSDDPVTDRTGEAVYIRDEETGRFWSPSLLPAGNELTYITRHGFGYSVFEHQFDGVYSELTVFVDIEDPVKFLFLKVINKSERPRKLSATGFIELVLGDNRVKTGMHIRTEVDPDSGALFAKNPYNTEFNNRVAFLDVDYLKKSYTGDRTEFIGRNGNLKNPEALSKIKLSNRVGLAMDPCLATQIPFFVAPEEEQIIIFRIGAAQDSGMASSVAKKFRGLEAANESLSKVKKYWEETIGALIVETPDQSINLITNGWLTYQTLSSRLWGRSGFYQSGGAFGFRDQLQDVMSLMHTRPELAKKQILLCSSRQFKEGDVQHWWHPPVGRGVRTRISDDYLWLPFVTSFYIKYSGDLSILNESTNFLYGRQLNFGEESYFDLPVDSHVSATLYEHCVLAIKHGLRFGVHGLPLIGTGDWNDGFDKVGQHGKGESVWLGFFLYEILIQFSEISALQNDNEFANTCVEEARKLKGNIDKSAWDGEWYKRAWFDDGTPLGSKENEECKIDSISQSWSVLSGGGNPNLVHTAMDSAYKYLVQKKSGIIQLLEPPFNNSALNPGYIKGYVPGVRENGGQYTHAACWMIMAFAELGSNNRVWELLNMVNPLNHGKTAEEIAIYKVEPYVIAADVYAGKQHAGRGGWTWYTGSAGWMYRVIIESFLGLKQQGNKLFIKPCVPEHWNSFKINYRYQNSVYNITVNIIKNGGPSKISVNNVEQNTEYILLENEGGIYECEINI